MYVGFGDCFVVSFLYDDALDDGRSERHVLVDMGSTHAPKGRRGLVADAAGLIQEHTDTIDAVVATHRHRDHISGFGDKAAAQVIDAFDPKLVLRPWTDDPDLPTAATGPGEDSRNLAAALAKGQAFSVAVAAAGAGAGRRSLRGQLASAADEQIPNKDAIDQLEKWTANARGEYLAAGDTTRLEEIVPGIRVRVLGPPTVEQEPAMLKQVSKHEEFWMLHAGRLGLDLEHAFDARRAAELLLHGAGGEDIRLDPGPVSWLVERLDRQQLHSLLRIVRTVDDALNNTSLILLVDVGELRMLFPGDAQIENWSWSLKHAPNADEICELLRDVDLYKVGHHGSRNATPRTLFRLWGEDPDPQREIVALMSTLSDVHGETEATKVPRETLVKALDRRMTLYTTDAETIEKGLTDEEPAPDGAGVPYVTVEAETSGGGFRRV
jgi:hypothetical protein